MSSKFAHVGCSGKRGILWIVVINDNIKYVKLFLTKKCHLGILLVL